TIGAASGGSNPGTAASSAAVAVFMFMGRAKLAARSLARGSTSLSSRVAPLTTITLMVLVQDLSDFFPADTRARPWQPTQRASKIVLASPSGSWAAILA